MTYQLPFTNGQRVVELGGGEKPVFRPNVDTRPLPTVDIVADFNKALPLDTAAYDGVFASYVLEHVSWRKVREFVSGVARILKPGGIAVFVIPNTHAQFRWALAKADWDEAVSQCVFGDQDYPDNTHRVAFDPDFVTTIFRAAGFGSVLVVPHGELATDMIVEARRDNVVQSGTEPVKVASAVAPSAPSASQAATWTPEQRKRAYGRAYFNGGGEVGGYAREGYWDYPIHWATFRKVMERRPESILEIGSARGFILKRAEDTGVRVKGLEVSEHCRLTRAVEDVVNWDLTQTPWPVKDKEFDLALSVAMLEHIPESAMPAVAAELARTCKRGLHGVDFGGHDDGFDKTHCFPVGTSVALYDGVRLPIELVAVGDLIVGADGGGSAVETTVTRVYRRESDVLVQLTLDTGGTLLVTPEHPVWVETRGWVRAGDVASGDEVRCAHSIAEAVHDHEALRCGGVGALSRPSAVQAEKRAAGRGGIRHVFRVAKVVSTERLTRVGTPVFNLETATHNYVAGGILVHNCTLKPREWWLSVLPPGHEVVDKEELEKGPADPPGGDGKVKVNVGSFTTMFHHGWVNVDQHQLHKFAHAYGFDYRQYDVRGGLLFTDRSVDLIFACHFVEHLTFAEGLAFLRECRRVMKDGATLRIVVPDARRLAQCYLDGKMSQFDELNEECAGTKLETAKLWSLLLAGHVAMYDGDGLVSLLKEVGFSQAIQMPFRKSLSPQITRETLDPYPSLSIFVDAVK